MIKIFIVIVVLLAIIAWRQSSEEKTKPVLKFKSLTKWEQYSQWARNSNWSSKS